MTYLIWRVQSFKASSSFSTLYQALRLPAQVLLLFTIPFEFAAVHCAQLAATRTMDLSRRLGAESGLFGKILRIRR